jgi:hypothetical protein
MFFDEVELVFHAIGLQPLSPLVNEDTNRAIRLAHGYFNSEARWWFTNELEEAGTTIESCLGSGKFPFSWVELKHRM